MNIVSACSPLLKEYELKQNPIVVRVNKFDEDSAKSFADAMSRAQNTGQPIIPVIIDSYGGQVYSLMSMISAIRSSRTPVATVVEGKAMSCGAILFTFGAQGYRFMTPESTLMIHDVSSGAFGKVEEIKSDAKEVERLNQRVYQMMAANCGKDPNYFLDMVHEKSHADWYLTPEEAVQHGIANHIRMPELKMTVDVKYRFE